MRRAVYTHFLLIFLSLAAGALGAAGGGQTDIEAYFTSPTARVGETVDIFISTDQPEVTITARLYKVGAPDPLITLATGLAVTLQPTPVVMPWRNGPDWESSLSFVIPANWEPGIYTFVITSDADPSVLTKMHLAVRAAVDGSHSKVAVLLNDTTINAYNRWGGKSNYTSNLWENPGKSYVLATARPGNHYLNVRSFLFNNWARRIGMPIEYISALDLQFEEDLLDSYDVLVLVGHSEYWSREMRSALEAFLDQGGKLISLSGNTMWWVVRFVENEHGIQMISCKGQEIGTVDCPADPNMVTDNWHEIDPEIMVMGASYLNGGWVNADINIDIDNEEGYGGYFVHDDSSWFWAGTGVYNEDQVGQEEGIAGYESDSPPLINSPDGPIIDPAAIVPAGIKLLGSTPAIQGGENAYGAIVHFPYGTNGGEVFNCGSIDCAWGLETNIQWHKAISNVFHRFGALTSSLTDYDGDGIDDCNDNCVSVFNQDQLDVDLNLTGDACEDTGCHPTPIVTR